MTLVIDGVSPPFQHEVKGLIVMYFDLLTREELGRGLVLRRSTIPMGQAMTCWSGIAKCITPPCQAIR
jgi:hypothetical protein